jgi:hypothetical protein
MNTKPEINTAHEDAETTLLGPVLREIVFMSFGNTRVWMHTLCYSAEHDRVKFIEKANYFYKAALGHDLSRQINSLPTPYLKNTRFANQIEVVESPNGTWLRQLGSSESEDMFWGLADKICYRKSGVTKDLFDQLFLIASVKMFEVKRCLELWRSRFREIVDYERESEREMRFRESLKKSRIELRKRQIRTPIRVSASDFVRSSSSVLNLCK